MISEAKLAELFGSDWKQYPAFPAYYFSRDGRCAKVPKKAAPRLLIGCTCGIGYRAISFCDGSGSFKREYIHRVVCELFNGPSNGLPCCRHLDGDLTNCAAYNLAWGTQNQNMEDMARHGRTGKGERNSQAKLTAALVSEMRNRRAATNLPFKNIAAQFGVSTMTAFRAITGETWK